jgi:hypothetical protein
MQAHWLFDVRQDNAFQSGHERLGKVTVLQQHPVACFARCVQQRSGLWSLTLAQGNGVKPFPEALFIRKPVQDAGRVRALGQDEDTRGLVVHVAVDV